MRDLRDVVNGESVCEADGASLAVAVGPMAVGDIGRYRERTRSVW
jgi:hypothetical protein